MVSLIYHTEPETELEMHGKAQHIVCIAVLLPSEKWRDTNVLPPSERRLINLSAD